MERDSILLVLMFAMTFITGFIVGWWLRKQMHEAEFDILDDIAVKRDDNKISVIPEEEEEDDNK